MTTAVATAHEQVTLSDGAPVDLVANDDDGRVTITAWDADGAQLGTAWFRTGPIEHPAQASVEVVPAHRGRGLGSLLLGSLIDEASARGIRWLTWTQDADDPAVVHLAKASHAICARRVSGGRATSAILVPAA